MFDVKRLKDIREDHDLSQAQIAKILNTSRSTYSLWELGINSIPLSSLFKFSKYFNLSIDYILNNSKSKKHINKNSKLDLKTLGVNIKKNRIKNNISQENLAKLLGVSQPCIVRYEKGIIEISIYNLYQIASILDISIDELLSQSEKIAI